jgi:hypothetical protein
MQQKMDLAASCKQQLVTSVLCMRLLHLFEVMHGLLKVAHSTVRHGGLALTNSVQLFKSLHQALLKFKPNMLLLPLTFALNQLPSSVLQDTNSVPTHM